MFFSMFFLFFLFFPRFLVALIGNKLNDVIDSFFYRVSLWVCMCVCVFQLELSDLDFRLRWRNQTKTEKQMKMPIKTGHWINLFGISPHLFLLALLRKHKRHKSCKTNGTYSRGTSLNIGEEFSFAFAGR